MNEKEWEMFFHLLGKIVDLPGTFEEKQKLVEQKAEEHGDMNLEEFTAWNWYS